MHTHRWTHLPFASLQSLSKLFFFACKWLLLFCVMSKCLWMCPAYHWVLFALFTLAFLIWCYRGDASCCAFQLASYVSEGSRIGRSDLSLASSSAAAKPRATEVGAARASWLRCSGLFGHVVNSGVNRSHCNVIWVCLTTDYRRLIRKRLTMGAECRSSHSRQWHIYLSRACLKCRFQLKKKNNLTALF